MDLVSLSENTLLVLFEQTISDDIFQQVVVSARKIESKLSHYIIDIIPSYTSIHVVFNLTTISHADFKKKLSEVITSDSHLPVDSASEQLITIPVYYGEEVALDLELVAKKANLQTDEVITIHSDKVYDVYAMGFSPGFAYLGNVDQSISISRKETPRTKISAGSLGIADQQTAIYPSDSPGGWQIIGKTPRKLIDYNSEELTLFKVGNKVKFSPVSREEYLHLGGLL